MRSRRLLGAWLGLLIAAAPSAGAADVAASPFDEPWPSARVRRLEVGRHDVVWRHALRRAEGLRAGVSFVAPLSRERLWAMTDDFEALAGMTSVVRAVRVQPVSETRDRVEADVRVLWRSLTLAFEVDRVPPGELRFRLLNTGIGPYEGRMQVREAGEHTAAVDLQTLLKPGGRLSMRLALLAQRMAVLSVVREFLEQCDREAKASGGPQPTE